MATGKFTISVNGVQVWEGENPIMLGNEDILVITPTFEVQDEKVLDIFAIVPDHLLFDPALPRRGEENGKRG